jgi:hypothetical protein
MTSKLIGKREGKGWVLRLRVGNRWLAQMSERGSRTVRVFNTPEDCAKAARALSKALGIDSTVRMK